MSGPKSYHVSVFNKQLKKLFLLRAGIAQQWEKLLEFEENGSRELIRAKAVDFIRDKKSLKADVLADMPWETKEQLSQEQFDRWYGRIHRKLESLEDFNKQLTEQLDYFHDLETAFREYLDFVAWSGQLQDDFEFLKSQVKNNLINTGVKRKISDKLKLIDQVVFTDYPKDFDEDFLERKEKEKRRVSRSFEEARQRIGEIVSAEEKLYTTRKPDSVLGKVKNSNEIEELEQKIRRLIRQLDKQERSQFEQRLSKFAGKSDRYFYVELMDDIMLHVKNRKLTGELKQLLERIESTRMHFSLIAEFDRISDSIRKAMHHRKLRSEDVENIKLQVNSILKQNNQKLAEAEIAGQERNYIKSRLVSALKDLGYEVTEDTRLIDLEKADDLLLSIPGQENFLNLRFDDEGRMLYNFLIPEDRDDLTLDEKSVKLSEMEETCDEFNRMLRELQQQGLDVELKKELPVTEKALIRVPDRLIKRLKPLAQHSSKSVKQLRKKSR